MAINRIYTLDGFEQCLSLEGLWIYDAWFLEDLNATFESA